jgi:hypothetical protein
VFRDGSTAAANMDGLNSGFEVQKSIEKVILNAIHCNSLFDFIIYLNTKF